MKRILFVILTLCLLCAVPFTLADVDYVADYEAALTLARNDLTNAQNLQEAIDILQRLGGYELSRSYLLYFEALADLSTETPDIETAGMYISILQESPDFVADMAERGFPSFEKIVQYIRARELEIQGDRAGAYDLLKTMSILDAPLRAVSLRKAINDTASTVSVIYRAEDGATLDEETVTIAKGGEQVIAAREFEGYALTEGSQKSVKVTVDSLGRQSHREIVFIYRKLPDTVVVTVICRTDTGKELSRGIADVERGGSLTVEAKVFDGYELASDTSDQVKVFADNLGNLSQDKVVFTYKAIPTYAEVTVICTDMDGTKLRTQTVHVERGTSRTIKAGSIDGYELTSVSSAVVKVDAEGKADRPLVVFRYQRIKPKVSVGDYVTFGHYPQTETGNDNTPIEWLVLDVQDGKILLLSRYGLDAKPYNKDSGDATWEECTLREWLNGEFVNKAFTAQEQRAVLTTNVDNSKSQGYSGFSTNGGNNTQDKVFLLSYAEAHTYLGVTLADRNNMKSREAPTRYAIKNGATTSSNKKTVDGLAAGWWWLRSPGRNQNRAAGVGPSGSLYYSHVISDYGIVRPAFWLNLDSGIF